MCCISIVLNVELKTKPYRDWELGGILREVHTKWWKDKHREYIMVLELFQYYLICLVIILANDAK